MSRLILDRSSKRFLKIAACAFLAIHWSILHAQSNEGALAGTITDPTGSAVVGASVNAADLSTGQSFKAVSTTTGGYRFPVLLVGTYTVTVTAPGFKVAQRNGVAVQIQSTTSLDIQLTIGTSSETMEVNANAPQLQTESSDVGTVVTPRQVLDLPLSTNGAAIRNSQDFVSWPLRLMDPARTAEPLKPAFPAARRSEAKSCLMAPVCR